MRQFGQFRKPVSVCWKQMKKTVMVSNWFKTGFMQQMDSLTNCFETETGLNAPNSPLILTIFLSGSWQITFHDHFGPRPIERRRSCKDRQLCMGDWRRSCLRLIVYKTKNIRPRHPNVNVIFRPFALPPHLQCRI